MIPKKFTLTGALGIKAGLNRESITIDLSNIPDDAVTVAIRGDNGMGKSTILNLALTPFRLPPHVDDIYSCFDNKGLRELEFEHGGRYYKSVISINQTEKTKSMSSSLYIFENDWVPVETLFGDKSDGKNTTYDRCLEYVLGPKSIYFMSAFKAQNAKPLADHDDPKSLMRDLLSLDEPDKLSTQANEVVKQLRYMLEQKRATIEHITTLEEQLEFCLKEITRLNEELPKLRAEKQTAIDAATDAKAAYESARTQNADNVELQKKHDALNEQKRQLVGGHNGTMTRINNQIMTLESRIRSNKTLMDSADAVEQAEKQEPILESQLDSLSKSLVSHRETAKRKSELLSDLRNLQTQCHNITANGKQLAAKCADLEKRAGYIDKVPCHGDGEFSQCPALQDAINAKTLIPTEQKNIEIERDKWNSKAAEAEKIRTEISNIGNIESTIRETEEQINQTNIALANARNTASKRHALNQAQTIINESERDLQELTVQKADVVSEYNQRASQLIVEMEALPPINPDDQLAHATQRLDETERALETATRSLENYISSIANTEATRDKIKRDLSESDTIKAEVERIGNEMATWKLLSMALKGVIDLSIEDAGPAISSIANRLLTEAYGPRFSLNIVTQKTLGNGTLKETFDISVIDAESGIESSIVKKSGGEMVWLDKALTDAVALYHKDAADIDYECLFADEAEDGLSHERKDQFYKMDRAALALGGFKRKFFISHNPSAWQLADHVIDLSEYRQ